MGGFGGLGDAHLDDVADLWLPRLLSVKGRVSPSYLINAGSILGGWGGGGVPALQSCSLNRKAAAVKAK